MKRYCKDCKWDSERFGGITPLSCEPTVRIGETSYGPREKIKDWLKQCQQNENNDCEYWTPNIFFKLRMLFKKGGRPNETNNSG